MTNRTSRVADDSTLVALAHSVVTHLQQWVAASWVANKTESLTNALATATDASSLANGVRTLARWIRHSYLFRWLTKEPEPDVVVIDLRETYTLGPVIALLDRLTPVVERTWRGSLAHRLTQKLRRSSKRAWIANSRTIRLLVAALEPPELPEDEERS